MWVQIRTCRPRFFVLQVSGQPLPPGKSEPTLPNLLIFHRIIKRFKKKLKGYRDTENAGDGKTIKVDWTRLDPFKTWFGPGVLREAIHRVDASDGYIKKQLLAFTFGDEEQDYSLCEEKYSDDIDQTAGVDEMPDDAVEDDMDVATSTGDSETAKKKTCLEVVRTPRVNLIHPLNFIIYGAPGTGKTYSTAEYALAISVLTA